MSFEDEERKLLEDMKRRRDLLSNAIVQLEYDLLHPLPPIKIDFKAIEEETRRDMEFLEKCKRERELKTE